MANLQDVIKERDTAVKLLELGITGDPPQKECFSGLGRRYRYTYQEHLMPYWRNPRYTCTNIDTTTADSVAR